MKRPTTDEATLAAFVSAQFQNPKKLHIPHFQLYFVPVD
jgi:hypothetical protein